jgi:hypothetical protein
VGKPKDNNQMGCYVVQTIDENDNMESNDTISAEFIRFEYDVQKAAKAIGDSPIPNEYAEKLPKGS